jgi:low temperature requirement protein LtrA
VRADEVEAIWRGAVVARTFAAVKSIRWRETSAAPAGPVTPVELFFDLVFVFTLTQLTHTLEEELSLAAAGRVLLLFGVLWWMYGGYAWLTNHVPPRRTVQKLLLFAGMAGFLIAAVGVPHAFGAGVLFGFGYLIVIVVHLTLFTQADVLAGVLRLAPFNLASALLILGAGFVDGPLVYALWIAALLLQAIAPYAAPKRSGGVATAFHVSAAHFVERHGLLVIVALGESVIAIGMGVDVEHLTAGTVGVIVLALALPAALWWTYFSDARAAEHALAAAEERARSLLAISAYFFAHIPLLLGIVFAAAGIHAAIAHPGEAVAVPSALALAGGVALFLLGEARVRRSLGIGSAAGRVVAAVAVLATVPVGKSVSAGVQLVLVIIVVVAMLGLDATRAGIENESHE